MNTEPLIANSKKHIGDIMNNQRKRLILEMMIASFSGDEERHERVRRQLDQSSPTRSEGSTSTKVSG